jgi:hypothetical protein
MRSLGVRVVFLQGNIDTETAVGRLYFTMLAAFAEFERETISERTSSGRARRAKEGLWVGGQAPFGHEVVEQRLVVNEAEAQTLRGACELLTSGATLSEAAYALNDEGHLPRQWNPRSGLKISETNGRTILWDSESLRRILALESLRGTYTHGKTSKSGETVTYEVPPILDQTTFDHVQAHLRATSKNPSRDWKVYPLSQGRLVSPCGMHCSGMWVTRKGRRYYRCKGKEGAAAQRCSCPYYFPADEIEGSVLGALMPLLEDPKRLLELTGLDREDDARAVGDQVRLLDAKIATLDDTLTKRVADALTAGMSPDRIAKATKQLEDELASLRERRELAASIEAQVGQRKERRQRLKRLTRASLKVVNAENDLVFFKRLMDLLDVQACMTPEGIKIKGVLREDLPFALNVHEEKDYADRQIERRLSR